MNGIMQHLKLFARKTPMALESVSIVDVLNDTLVIMERAMREAEVTLLRHDLDRRVKVKAEPVRLQQVFTNLLQNAIDSMCNSQHRVIEISMTQQQDRIQLIVTDSGSGIDDELRKHLFEPFVTTKTGGDGLGLGLAITHQIIQQFGGEITVDTSRAGGARFCLTLVSAGRVAEEVAA
jgi:two-component system C4-dicarboxylate transport sensor histidine kinase DctB